MDADKTKTIRELNDQLRSTFTGGRIVMTHGVNNMGSDALLQVAKSVRAYDDFSEDNDPYGEHDFGAFEVNGQKLFWKIDYYAEDMMHGSSDASDASVTTRVLTIMLASEY